MRDDRKDINRGVVVTEEEGGKPPMIEINEGPTQPELRVQFSDELEKAEEEAQEDEEPEPRKPEKSGSFALGMKTIMRLAIKEAKKAGERGEIPVGAVILKDGEVISAAANMRETESDPAGHAEIRAMREAAKRLGDWRLKGCELYVTLEPCPMCFGAIQQTKLKRLVYGASDPTMGAVDGVLRASDFPNANKGLEIYAGVLEDECSGILKGFFNNRRKK